MEIKATLSSTNINKNVKQNIKCRFFKFTTIHMFPCRIRQINGNKFGLDPLYLLVTKWLSI